MPHVQSLHIGLGGPEFDGVRAAELIPVPDLSGALCRRFRQELMDTPLHFLDAIRIPEYPRIRVQWVGLVKTAGIILLRSGDTYPDSFSLLLNGVETEDEMTLVYRHAGPLAPHWQAILDARRPLAVNGYFRPSRMSDSAVTTVLGAFANAYFTQFGTNEE